MCRVWGGHLEEGRRGGCQVLGKECKTAACSIGLCLVASTPPGRGSLGMPSHSVQAQLLTPVPSLQFDFTSCQGVIFVLLMTLFFSGLILAILLPFQYVSLRVSQ